MQSLSRKLLTLLIILCGVAQTPLAYADYSSSERWFNQKPEDDRFLIQTSLILLGHYGATSDGEFGNYTFQAITAFQKAIGERPDGVLTSAASNALLQKSSTIFQELGMAVVKDQRGQMSMVIPEALLSREADTRRGSAYFNADDTIRLETITKPFSEQSYDALYRSLSTSSAARKVTYKHYAEDAFVVSGVREGRSFYIRMSNTPGESTGFSLEWVPTRNELASMLAVFMASHAYPLAFETEETFTQAEENGQSKPATSVPQSQAASPPKGTSSGSGFFVAENGVLVTNQHVVDGCSIIQVKGFGDAKLITSNDEVDLAVLQLLKPTPHPVAEIRTSPVELGEDVVAMGYPLASLLNSSLTVLTGIVSSETGLMGEPRWFTTNVGLQPGNSGGPVLDEHGRVVGVAVAKINDEVLLASTGNIASNVGFAIKGETVSEYLSIFRLPDASPPTDAPKNTKELVELGRKFTVQVTCEVN